MDDWPPRSWGDWILIGPDIWITRPVEIRPDEGDSPTYPFKRSWFAHKRPDGRNDALGRVEFSPGHHTLVSEDPLTISPSLLCPDPKCGVHGFVRDGRWVPA